MIRIVLGSRFCEDFFMKATLCSLLFQAFAACLLSRSPAQADSADASRLEAVISRNAPVVRAVQENRLRLDSSEFAAARKEIDSAANQRDAYAAGLHWYTDLASAQKEAARTSRPILSLRLLGKLDEEFSCANSRFFRTLLYPDPLVSEHLRKKYVLHWKSVRPAPVITIDMGDGRRIKRTITGNSIHYILDASGQVLDALPGVYSPQAFLAALHSAEEHCIGKTLAERRAWHGLEAGVLCKEWLMTAVLAGVYGQPKDATLAGEALHARLQQLAPRAFPAASHAAKLSFSFSPEVCAKRFSLPKGEVGFPVVPSAASSAKVFIIKPFPYNDSMEPSDFDPPKGMVERPIAKAAAAYGALPALDPASPVLPTESLAGSMNAAAWAKMGQRYRHLVSLSPGSRSVMLQKQPEGSSDAGNAAFERMLNRFLDSVASDMLRNEYFYHTQIHQWLETATDMLEVETLNKRVYAELFLTPDYDAWLGLMPEDTYTALEKDGCACDAGAQPMRAMRNAP